MEHPRGLPHDAMAIADVHVRSWKSAYPGLIPQPYLDALRPEDRLARWTAVFQRAGGHVPESCF